MGGRHNGFEPPQPDRVQIAQAMKIAELTAFAQAANNKIEQMMRRESLLLSALQRFRAAVIDMAGDRDLVDIGRPIHTVSREHLAEIDKQSIRCDVLPDAEFLALEVFVWTTEEGDAAQAERIKARSRKQVPDEPLEVVKKVITS